MLRRVLGLVGAALAIGLLSGLLAGCGGPPKFVSGPGKVRISPIPQGHGQVNYPANVTVDGTGFYIFTHGLRRVDGKFQLNVSVIANPSGSSAPSDTAVQAWLGKGDTMSVDGYTVTMLAVYDDSSQGDVRVRAGAGASSSVPASPHVS